MTIVEGFTNFTFNCDSKNPEKTFWRYDMNKLPVNAQSNGNVLHLHNVNRFNSGYFECQFIVWEALLVWNRCNVLC